MSNKDNLKDKIKKPSPTKVFFQAYEEEKRDSLEISVKEEEFTTDKSNKLSSKLNDLLSEDSEKKVSLGVYVELEVAQIIDKLAGNKYGKKSKIVNEILKDAFIEMGLLKQ